ncbi:MAG TPA: LacI family DNA-binding transcriptional regulator [Longimicrobiaceae bacterium]|nr:LacI family DNA-binding transcriptional regulator [Longimicrobiaceae bacterium]
MKRPTITDVARSAGVSKATVSAVLNEKPSVRASTRERVLGVIEALNYRPSSAGPRAGGAARGGRTIGLLIKEMDNPYYAEIAVGVGSYCRSRGYQLLVASSEGEAAAEKEAIERLREQEVSGLLIMPVLDEDTDLSHLFELKRRNFPFVLLEQIRGVRASLVDVENVEASRGAVEYLFSLGHTRIVHFAGPRYSMHSEERIDGVRRAFSRSSLRLGEEAIHPVGAHLEEGYRAGLEYFGTVGEKERATAVTCYNDLVALGLCRALGELGLKVPEEVSVVGFDDLAMLPYMGVALTTVHVPKAEMGERAAEMLVRRIESPHALPPERVTFEGKLVLRGSTARAAGRAVAVPARSG